MFWFTPYIVIAVIALLIGFLIWDRFKPSYVFFTAVVFFLLTGIADTSQVINGFSNSSIIVIFLLILLTVVLNKTYNLIGLLDTVFSGTVNPKRFILKMSAAVGISSGVMNNTPIVALMIPYIYRWSSKRNYSPSKLYIPLSYAAILGGMLTPIGTSTNLVLLGFMESEGAGTLPFHSFFLPGIAALLVGTIVLAAVVPYLLPVRDAVLDDYKKQVREYMAETKVIEGSDIVGKTIAQAELRNLDGIFLCEIHRDSNAIKPVNPNEVLRAGDRLYFAGDTDRILEVLKNFQGLDWAKKDDFELGDDIEIVEVVIPFNSNLEGQTLKSSEFREKYDAAVVAIHRNGERLTGKLGEQRMTTGDMMLLTAGPDFNKRVETNSNLYTVSVISETTEYTGKQKIIYGVSFLTIVGCIVGGVFPLFHGLTAALGLAVFMQLITGEAIKKNLSLDLFIILGSALTVGDIFIQTGAAEMIAQPFVQFLLPFGKLWIMIGIFILTALFTSFITNVAAVSILFPIVFKVVTDLDLNPAPFYLALAFGASAAFLTPVSYQTNLMVMGPGNYKFKDFMTAGAPMIIVYGTVVIFMLNLLYDLNG